MARRAPARIARRTTTVASPNKRPAPLAPGPLVVRYQAAHGAVIRMTSPDEVLEFVGDGGALLVYGKADAKDAERWGSSIVAFVMKGGSVYRRTKE